MSLSIIAGVPSLIFSDLVWLVWPGLQAWFGLIGARIVSRGRRCQLRTVTSGLV